MFLRASLAVSAAQDHCLGNDFFLLEKERVKVTWQVKDVFALAMDVFVWPRSAVKG